MRKTYIELIQGPVVLSGVKTNGIVLALLSNGLLKAASDGSSGELGVRYSIVRKRDGLPCAEKVLLMILPNIYLL